MKYQKGKVYLYIIYIIYNIIYIIYKILLAYFILHFSFFHLVLWYYGTLHYFTLHSPFSIFDLVLWYYGTMVLYIFIWYHIFILNFF